MMYQMLNYILETCGQYPFVQEDIGIEELVFNFALPPGHNIVMNTGALQFAQFIFTK
jgi:hypothetical protein